MQLLEGNEGGVKQYCISQNPVLTRKQATVYHQTLWILSGSSDKFHQGQRAVPCNFTLEALSASSLFLLLAEINTCAGQSQTRPGAGGDQASVLRAGRTSGDTMF